MRPLPATLIYAGLACAALSSCQGTMSGSSMVGASSTPIEQSSLSGPRGIGAPFSGPHSPIDPARAAGMLRPGDPQPSWMKPAPAGVRRGDAYVSQFKLTYVSEYAAKNKKNAPPTCEIQGQPYVNGLGVDTSGHVWVPQGAAFSGVTTEFDANCGKALFSINDTSGQPAAVAFDSKNDVYVENISGTSSNFLGSIDVYQPGSKNPSTVLTDSASFLWFDEAIDASDNVYAVYSDPYNKGHVIEFAGGQNPSKDLPMTLGFPGGITFDSAGNLLVVDQDARNVSVYAPPFTGSAIATFPLQADSVPCKFNHSMKQLYCADFTNASIDVYNYAASNPGATKYAYSFTNGIQRGSENAGIALSPAPPN